jgi:hypothetical protein
LPIVHPVVPAEVVVVASYIDKAGPAVRDIVGKTIFGDTAPCHEKLFGWLVIRIQISTRRNESKPAGEETGRSFLAPLTLNNLT